MSNVVDVVQTALQTYTDYEWEQILESSDLTKATAKEIAEGAGLDVNVVLETITIAEAFPGVTFSKIDAALDYGNGNVQFFSGNEFTRFNKKNGWTDDGYPKEINEKTDIYFTFEEIKERQRVGKPKVVSLKFNIFQNEKAKEIEKEK